MMGWLMRLFSRKDAVPPPPPPNPYRNIPEPALPAGQHQGRQLTIAESAELRARFATRRRAIEQELNRQEGRDADW